MKHYNLFDEIQKTIMLPSDSIIFRALILLLQIKLPILIYWGNNDFAKETNDYFSCWLPLWDYYYLKKNITFIY